MTVLEPRLLRRLALHRQGLTQRAPFGSGRNGTLRALVRLGYVQIDTISVVARAHDHALWARVPGYSSNHLERLVARREAFEYWFHAAAFLPMCNFRFALPRMRASARLWFATQDHELVKHVLARIRSEGPLKARDFEQPPGRRRGWWDWKPAKRALEQLFFQGELMITRREGFEKVYDLPERVLPSHVDTREPTVEEHAAHLVDVTLEAHGFASLKAFTYQRRSSPLREAVKRTLNERIAAGTITKLDVADARGRTSAFYARPNIFDSVVRVPAEVRMLSPFDNALIQRDRNVVVHDFDYQLECYVEPHRRRFGYFCLPLLYRDRFVGRADCKAHRSARRFEVVHLFIEREIPDADKFLEALHDAIARYAEFTGCESIDVRRVSPRAWTGPVRRTLR